MLLCAGDLCLPESGNTDHASRGGGQENGGKRGGIIQVNGQYHCPKCIMNKAGSM